MRWLTPDFSIDGCGAMIRSLLKKGTGTSGNAVLRTGKGVGLGASPLFQRAVRLRLGRFLSLTGWVVAGCSVAAAACCYLSYRGDCARLRVVAREVTGAAVSPSERVLALLHFVSGIAGTRQNQDYFLWPGLRATPAQVLEAGGDCADRSRLLSALLREVGISATPAMCFDKKSGVPSHTLVEAEPAEGVYMIVDPVYDLYFPKPDGPGYYSLLDLRRDSDIVTRRVDELCARSPPAREADRYYMRAFSGYHGVATINWKGSSLARLVHDGLKARMGEEIYRIPRPAVLEEPKLSVGTACLLPGVVLLPVFGGAALVRGRRRRRHGATRVGA